MHQTKLALQGQELLYRDVLSEIPALDQEHLLEHLEILFPLHLPHRYPHILLHLQEIWQLHHCHLMNHCHLLIQLLYYYLKLILLVFSQTFFIYFCYWQNYHHLLNHCYHLYNVCYEPLIFYH